MNTFDNPNTAVVKVTIRGPWAVALAVSEQGCPMLAAEIERMVPVIMRELGNHDGYNAEYKVEVQGNGAR